MPIMSDREQLVRWTRVDLNDKEALLIIQTTSHKSKPIREDVVRAQLLKVQLLRQDEANPADLKITDFTTMDMKGYFPSRLMNMAMSSMISKGVSEVNAKLREIQAGK